MTAATLEDHFWAKVDKAGDCWLWTASVNKAGYGKVFFRGINSLAHRVSYSLTAGEIPEGFFVCHHCDNPPCVRPDHLFVGSAADNNADMRRKGRNALPKSKTGEAHHSARVPDSVVREIRERYAAGGVAIQSLAAEVGVDRHAVARWLRGLNRVSAGGPTTKYVAPRLHHGGLTCYKRGCRCEPCRDAGRAYRARQSA